MIQMLGLFTVNQNIGKCILSSSGSGGGPSLFLVKKGEKTEERKASRVGKSNWGPAHHC